MLCEDGIFTWRNGLNGLVLCEMTHLKFCMERAFWFCSDFYFPIFFNGLSKVDVAFGLV